jgi:hypothetical protein
VKRTPHSLPTRRTVLRAAGVLPAALAARPAAAAGPANAKADVKYQFTPKGADHCGACVSFLAGESTGGPGTCRLVQGPIPQNGWCVLFARRRP